MHTDEKLPMIGTSFSNATTVYTNIAKITKTNHTVLITGESGTGKELVAKAILVQLVNFLCGY